MPNDYFKFKQFTVHQSRCAMKVGTDGVLLGGWASVEKATNALDIGTGTGLIALMLAQRNPKLWVKAIDIDRDAVLQAQENIAVSPFLDRVCTEEISLSRYAGLIGEKLDLIVSNPPFFNDSLKSPDNQRSLARHDDFLPLEELISVASQLLTENGRFALIYPYEGKDRLVELARDNRLYPSRITHVLPTPDSKPKRILMELTKQQKSVDETNLIIEQERHVYSEDFTNLLKDFYLKF